MASKKRYEFQIFSNRAKNSAAQELQSPAPPMKKKGIFSPSFRRDGHIVISRKIIIWGNNGGIAFLKGEIMGDLMPNFARSFRKDGHNHIEMRVKRTNPKL